MMLPMPSSTEIISNITPEATVWLQYFLPVAYVAIGIAFGIFFINFIIRLFSGGVHGLFGGRDQTHYIGGTMTDSSGTWDRIERGGKKGWRLRH